MIKRLRLKFILNNMTIVTVMLCVIFGMIYYFTQSNLEQKSIDMMRAISQSPAAGPRPENPDEVRQPYFSLQIGIDGEITAAGGGFYDLTNVEFLKELADTALSSQREYGVIGEYNLRFLKIHDPMNKVIAFTDISSEKETLRSLVQTSIGIGLASFLVFLGISILLSRWAVRPIEQAWKLQHQFVADASHELKTPLTVILTNAELMEENDGENKNRRYTDNIITMSRRMKGLVNQMLELARAENMNIRPVSEDVDLSKAVNDAIMPFEPVFFEAGKDLRFDIDESIVVKGESEKYAQVIQILLDNARKYSKDHAKVTVTLKKNRRNHCLLGVASEGETIPREELENIFKRFYRLNKARSDGDSFGLGLSLAEAIVKTYRGRIWAESKNGTNAFMVEFRTI